MNNIQELNQIIADAPDGASHISEFSYVKTDSVGRLLTWSGYSWNTARPNIQSSLADIRTIVEQAEENQALKERIAELEQELLKIINECDDLSSVEYSPYPETKRARELLKGSDA